MSSHKKGTLLTSFHIHSFVVFHTDLQKCTIVTFILTAQNQIMSNMQDCLLQLMQLIQYFHVSSFSTVINNEFIGEEFYQSQHSLNGYEAMGFGVTQLTQDEEPSLFTLKTNMPIPMLVYGDSFKWAKYGHHILPSNPDLASNNKASLHQTFWSSLIDIDFLCTYLDGNLSSNLNPQISFKLDHYLSRLFEGLSETGSKGEMFDQHLLNEKCNNKFVEDIVDIVLDATQIPLSIFTNIFHQRFDKHSMLESTLEILQQFYIQMETEPDDFHLFPGDLSTYTLRCIRCCQHVTLHSSIGEGRLGQIPSLLKSGVLISHLRESTFLRHILFLSCSFITPSMIFCVVCTHAQFY